MECYPPCRTCTGLCKAPVPARRVAPSTGGVTRTKKPVEPKPLPGYITLLCGTYTTREEQVIHFSTASKVFPRSVTNKTKWWCDKHSHWVIAYTATDRKPENTGTLPF